MSELNFFGSCKVGIDFLVALTSVIISCTYKRKKAISQFGVWRYCRRRNVADPKDLTCNTLAAGFGCRRRDAGLFL